jgi:hypothetical protein
VGRPKLRSAGQVAAESHRLDLGVRFGRLGGAAGSDLDLEDLLHELD